VGGRQIQGSARHGGWRLGSRDAVRSPEGGRRDDHPHERSRRVAPTRDGLRGLAYRRTVAIGGRGRVGQGHGTAFSALGAHGARSAPDGGLRRVGGVAAARPGHRYRHSGERSRPARGHALDRGSRPNGRGVAGRRHRRPADGERAEGTSGFRPSGGGAARHRGGEKRDHGQPDKSSAHHRNGDGTDRHWRGRSSAHRQPDKSSAHHRNGDGTGRHRYGRCSAHYQGETFGPQRRRGNRAAVRRHPQGAPSPKARARTTALEPSPVRRTRCPNAMPPAPRRFRRSRVLPRAKPAALTAYP